MNKQDQSEEMMEVFRAIKEYGNFEIVPEDIDSADLERKNNVKKLDLTSTQEMQINALINQMPTLASAATMAQVYTVSFPEGLPHTLTALHQGGYSTSIIDGGKYVGSASLYPLTATAVALGAFSAMSIVTGQYFLTKINSEMKAMNSKLDRILEFLYQEKNSELISSAMFARYAYGNYNSIMLSDNQRQATIASLQEVKRIALKDIIFYMNDMDSKAKVPADHKENLSDVSYAFDQTKNCGEKLNFSLDLYSMSTIMETYYSQNFEEDYLENIENDVNFYIDKCHNYELSNYTKVFNRLERVKLRKGEELNRKELLERLVSITDSLNENETSNKKKKAFKSAIHEASEKAEFFISADGSVYLKEKAKK